MRAGWMPATVLAMIVVLAAPAVGSGTKGSAAPADGTAAPAGFSLDCSATALAAPARSGGMLLGSGRGSCTMTGSFGAPWVLEVTVQLQARINGTWRTRGMAMSQIANKAATKRIPLLRAGLACSGGPSRTWRVKVVTRALANEKVIVQLKKVTAVSGTRSIAC